eukprot:Sdes_comp17742_c0_seq2m7008
MSTLSVAEKLVRLGSTSKLMTLYGISATKRLSQNFIYDQNLLDSLIRHCIPSKITEKYRFEALQKEFLSEMDTKKLHEMIHQKNPQLCLQQIQDFLQYRNFAGKNLPPTAHQVQTFFSALQAKHPPPSLSSSPPTASQNPADFMADIILSSPFRQNIFVDIGAGPGGLTRSLLKYGAGHVIAIEPDGRFLPLLEHLRSVVGEERLTIVHSVYEKWEAEKMLFRVTERFEHLKGLKEAAKQDHSNPNARMGSVLKVVGNLPFSVATKLTSLHIDKLHSGSHVFGFCADTEFYFMYQLEVANKICGKAHELKDSKSMKKTNSNLHLTLNHSFETKFLQKISRSGNKRSILFSALFSHHRIAIYSFFSFQFSHSRPLAFI